LVDCPDCNDVGDFSARFATNYAINFAAGKVIGAALETTAAQKVGAWMFAKYLAAKTTISSSTSKIPSKGLAQIAQAKNKVSTFLDKTWTKVESWLGNIAHVESLFKIGDKIVGIAIKQIRIGGNGKYAIIGRSMGNAEVTGVKHVYAELKNFKGLDVEIFDGSSLTGTWKTRFDEALAEFAQKTNNWTTRLSNQELLQLKMYKLNKEWAKHLVDDGYTIFDMGDFNNLGFSAFYAMEKLTIFK
jgi:hypothetical protein